MAPKFFFSQEFMMIYVHWKKLRSHVVNSPLKWTKTNLSTICSWIWFITLLFFNVKAVFLEIGLYKFAKFFVWRFWRLGEAMYRLLRKTKCRPEITKLKIHENVLSADPKFFGLATFWVLFSAPSAKKSYHLRSALKSQKIQFWAIFWRFFNIPWFTKPQRWGAWASACKRQAHFSKLQY